jgi:phospholipid/cholesterol/gamma-HCH transport system substrate-binding protein
LQGRLETRVGLFVLCALGIFVYMGFQIGSFRFDTGRYNTYTIYFKDISGLTRKSEVKIAGVKVGWVEKITLVPHEIMQAEAQVMVLKDFKLYDDSYAIVRQDGLLGPKYLEIVPGDPLLRQLVDGQELGKPSVEPVSIDDLLHKVKNIAMNVENVTDSLKNSIGGVQGQEQLQTIFSNLAQASEKIASFSDVLDRSISGNQDKIDSLLDIGNSVRRVTDKLELEVLPAVQESVQKVSGSFDRNFDRVADSLASTAKTLEDASAQARESFTNISSITCKVDEGKGLLGKLINEDETYHDLKTTIEGLKNYFAQINMMQIVFDAHGEMMHRPAQNYRYEDSKFFFDMRIHPNEDIFYIVGVATSERGQRVRRETIKDFFSNECLPVNAIELPQVNFITPTDKYRQVENMFINNTMSLELQFGKIFRDIALRAGLFEGFGGIAIDFDIPFRTEGFRWVMSMEAYDLTGWNHIPDDRRPHMKWYNRMFILRNIYVAFGADDFVSRHNSNMFVGFGLRFSDDDIKYLLPSLSGFAG